MWFDYTAYLNLCTTHLYLILFNTTARGDILSWSNTRSNVICSACQNDEGSLVSYKIEINICYNIAALHLRISLVYDHTQSMLFWVLPFAQLHTQTNIPFWYFLEIVWQWSHTSSCTALKQAGRIADTHALFCILKWN